MTEKWRDVLGWEGLYEISSTGRVRSLDRVVAAFRGSKRKIPGRIMKQHKNDNGYFRVGFKKSGGMRRPFSVHRLVLNAFVGPCPDRMEACHNDGNKTNNTTSNLRWDTKAANTADKLAHGTHLRGEQVHCSKLTESDVREIRKRLDNGEYQRVIAKDYGVSRAGISSIKTHSKWSHVK